MPFAAAIPAIMAGASLIGRLFGNAGKGAADQRITENDQRQRQATTANSDALNRAQLQSGYNLSGANLDLNQKQFQQNEPRVQAGNAARGSLLQNLQPLQMQGSARMQQSMPKMNSIIDALGPEARQAGGLLAQRSLQGMQNPTRFSPLAALNIPAYQQADIQKSGLLEKILGYGGLVGSTVGALGDLTSLGQSQPDQQFANQMPSPYTGLDRFGNPQGFQLPQGRLDDLTDYGENR